MQLIANNQPVEQYDDEGNDIIDPNWKIPRKDFIDILLNDFPDRAIIAQLALQHPNDDDLVAALEAKYPDRWEGKGRLLAVLGQPDNLPPNFM